MDDANFGSKYDRQIRLWNSNGQESLSTSKICLINVSTLSSEILKNLVLPGVNSIVIIDSSKIDEIDLSTNFLLDENDLNSYKSVKLAQNLKLLNPDISLHSITNNNISFNDSKFWSSFDCVIYCSIPGKYNETLESNLSNTLWNYQIPLLKVSTIGFYSFLKIQLNEQTIIETHENNLQDLRIDHPWTELQTYIDNIDISSNSNNEYYTIPYSIILSKVYQHYMSSNSTRPMPSVMRKIIKSLYSTGDEINLDEAYNKAYLTMKDSAELTPTLRDILNDEKTIHLDNSSTLFWILCNALKSFYDTYNILPLSGVLPDMESNTTEYVNLKKLYNEKFENDKLFIKEKTIKILKSLNRSPDEIIKNENLLNNFVKNSRYLKVIKGNKWDSMTKILDLYKTDNEELKQKALIYLAFLIVEAYTKENNRYPVNTDKSKLRTVAISILCNDHDVKTFPDGLDKILDEICRASGRELHNISAIMGGIAAQEVIKILTNQYIPVDNCLVFDGILGKTSTFKI